jgi:uncharacterized protein (DUF2235 family)
MGCFETVSAVGALFPRSLPFSSDNHITKTFRHALSLDEHRAAFQPQPWVRSIDASPRDECGTESVGASDLTQKDLGRKRVGILRTSLGVTLRGAKRVLRTSLMLRRRNVIENILLPQEGPSTDVKEVWFVGTHSGEVFYYARRTW